MNNIQAQFQSLTQQSHILSVLGQGFAQLYQQKPNFPITYFAQWLKQYSSTQKTKHSLIQSKSQKLQKYGQLQRTKQSQQQQKNQKAKAQAQAVQNQSNQYITTLNNTKHLQDLLIEWLPELIEKQYHLTGSYIGQLDYNKKPIEQHNFQPGAQNDTQNPKAIVYIGASKSHQKLMIKKILPPGQGRSYEVFEDTPEPEQGNEQTLQKKEPKKKYLYLGNILKQSRLFYFKYPKLGAYVCYPIRIKSFLSISSLNKGIADYKTFLKTKEDAEKEYQEKLQEARTEADDATKKAEDFQVNEEDPSTHQQKRVLQAQAVTAQEKVQQLQSNPPVIEQVQFQTIEKNYFLGGDTLGQDRQIQPKDLDNIQKTVQYFRDQWHHKQKSMLLGDILSFLQEQGQLESLQNQLHQYEKNVITTNQGPIKQAHGNNRQKQGQFQLSIVKAQKFRQFLNDPQIKNSMDVYLNYNIPKYTQLVQLWCMLLGYPKSEINLPKSNSLNHRKFITKQLFNQLIEKLQKYQLRRESSENVQGEYKINKILQRLQKIDIEGVAHYNGFLLVLHSVLRAYCWARILCRDARKQMYEAKIKLKDQKQNEINKWNDDANRNMENAKAQLNEQDQQNFKEQDWRRNYEVQNPRPQPIQVGEYQEHLDIQ